MYLKQIAFLTRLALLALVCAPLSTATAQGVIDAKSEHWYVIDMMGQKIGSQKMAFGYGSFAGKKAYYCLSESKYSLSRGSVSMELSDSTTSWVNANFRPLAFKSDRDQAGQKQFFEGNAQDGSLTVKHGLAGKSQNRVLQLTPETGLAGCVSFYLTLTGKLKKGATFDLPVILESWSISPVIFWSNSITMNLEE